jgi:hypothetical protein
MLTKKLGTPSAMKTRQAVMSNTQHMLVRVVAVAVLVVLHWFPHTHAAPLLASGAASGATNTGSNAANQAAAEHSDTDAVGVATIP